VTGDSDEVNAKERNSHSAVWMLAVAAPWAQKGPVLRDSLLDLDHEQRGNRISLCQIIALLIASRGKG
jgi:hypothetical protein